MARVVVLGSSNTDMNVRLPHLPSAGETVLGGAFRCGPGGKGANQAIAASRAGAEVVFLAAVGDDTLGREALDRYRRESIDVSHVHIISGISSGVALLFVSESGENMIGVAPGANSHLAPDDIERLPESVFNQGGVLLAGLEVPLATVASAVRRARRAGMLVILNPAPAPAPVDVARFDAEILPNVEILTPNQVEIRALADLTANANGDWAWQAIERLRARGARQVVITNGGEGCLVAAAGVPARPLLSIPAFPVVAVDTVGAGDAFNGALATATAEGRSLLASVVWASAAAALTVTQPGAQAALAHRPAIDLLAATYRPK